MNRIVPKMTAEADIDQGTASSQAKKGTVDVHRGGKSHTQAGEGIHSISFRHISICLLLSQNRATRCTCQGTPCSLVKQEF